MTEDKFNEANEIMNVLNTRRLTLETVKRIRADMDGDKGFFIQAMSGDSVEVHVTDESKEMVDKLVANSEDMVDIWEKKLRVL